MLAPVLVELVANRNAVAREALEVFLLPSSLDLVFMMRVKRFNVRVSFGMRWICEMNYVESSSLYELN